MKKDRKLTPSQTRLLRLAVKNNGVYYPASRGECRTARNLYVLNLGSFNEQTGCFTTNQEGLKAVMESLKDQTT